MTWSQELIASIAVFENAVRDDEVRGGGDPEDYEACHKRYLAARKALVAQIGRAIITNLTDLKDAFVQDLSIISRGADLEKHM